MSWYEFKPVDTLYFKGAEPMNLGENHTASHLFPPPAQTLAGALRTAVLIQNDISFESYAKGEAPVEISNAIGKAGEPAPFNLMGPLFMMGKEVYLPAPYSWFMEKKSIGDKVAVIKGKTIQSHLLKSETPEFIWAKGETGELVSLGGMWIKREDIHSGEAIIEVRKNEDFVENEPRIGIALDKSRRVREGHLYSFNHARFKENVSMIFGTDNDLPLKDRGVLKIGAEQRFGWYRNLPGDMMENGGKGDLHLSLSLLEGTDEVNQAVVATGKILYIGGWDMHKGFHKPMKGFFPAGTVCSKKINSSFITI